MSILLVMQGAGWDAEAQTSPLAEAIERRERGELSEAIDILERTPEKDLEVWLLLAETLSWAEQLDRAERIYREILPLDRSSRAREGLARTLQWKGNYDEAIRQYETILAIDPVDLDAIEGLARTQYWQGDFRTAEKLYERLLSTDPAREEARRDLEAIRLTTRPILLFDTSWRSDDQPYEMLGADVSALVFSDPLTKWIFRLGGTDLEAPAAGSTARFAAIGAEVGAPRFDLVIEAELRPFQFPDEETVWLGRAALRRNIGSGNATIFYERSEILWSAAAVDDHPWMENTGVSLGFDRAEGTSVRVELALLDFFDDNEGESISAYALVPVGGQNLTIRVFGGVSALYRDTAETRFELVSIDSRRLPGAGFDYDYEGIYDPYWSPLDLREARLLMSVASSDSEAWDWRIDATWGIARDDAAGFGPESGPFPFPRSPFDVRYSRQYEPWSVRAGVERAWRDLVFRISYEWSVTADYEAEVLGATLVRRF